MKILAVIIFIASVGISCSKLNESSLLVSASSTSALTSSTIGCSNYGLYETETSCQLTTAANCSASWQTFSSGLSGLCYSPVAGSSSCLLAATPTWIYSAPQWCQTATTHLFLGSVSVLGCSSSVCACTEPQVLTENCSTALAPSPYPACSPTPAAATPYPVCSPAPALLISTSNSIPVSSVASINLGTLTYTGSYDDGCGPGDLYCTHNAATSSAPISYTFYIANNGTDVARECTLSYSGTNTSEFTTPLTISSDLNALNEGMVTSVKFTLSVDGAGLLNGGTINAGVSTNSSITFSEIVGVNCLNGISVQTTVSFTVTRGSH